MKKDTGLNIYDLDLPALEALLTGWGEPTYRAGQIWEWLYKRLANDFDQMSSLPKSLREQLTEHTRLVVPVVKARQESEDGETRKDLLEMSDGELVEVVLMHYLKRESACISTQIGCPMGCVFCATGQSGFRRNLSAGEIVAQALHIARGLELTGQRLSNLVLMGMGEPLLNYDATLAAVRCLSHPRGFRLGQRHITVSTVGIVPGILRLAEEGLQVNLAVSLHAATDPLRSTLMPINRKHGLDALFKALAQYIERTNRQVTLEWVLIDGVNDTLEQAEALAARVTGSLVHVNLIPLNPTANYAGRPSAPERITAFTEILERRRIPFTARLRRGLDIQAGCGQLRRRQG